MYKILIYFCKSKLSQFKDARHKWVNKKIILIQKYRQIFNIVNTNLNILSVYCAK